MFRHLTRIAGYAALAAFVAVPANAQGTISHHHDRSHDSALNKIRIDPETRDIVQTIYIRKVGKIGGELTNSNSTKSMT